MTFKNENPSRNLSCWFLHKVQQRLRCAPDLQRNSLLSLNHIILSTLSRYVCSSPKHSAQSCFCARNFETHGWDCFWKFASEQQVQSENRIYIARAERDEREGGSSGVPLREMECVPAQWRCVCVCAESRRAALGAARADRFLSAALGKRFRCLRRRSICSPLAHRELLVSRIEWIIFHQASWHRFLLLLYDAICGIPDN